MRQYSGRTRPHAEFPQFSLVSHLYSHPHACPYFSFTVLSLPQMTAATALAAMGAELAAKTVQRRM